MGLQWGEGSGLWVSGVGCHGTHGKARQRAVIVVGVGVSGVQ